TRCPLSPYTPLFRSWDAIAELVQAVPIPVLGNGDIWEAADAVAMLEHTGASGVVIGRGCLGRPWLFAELAAAMTGRPRPDLPNRSEEHTSELQSRFD